jgi:hypothetical protein
MSRVSLVSTLLAATLCVPATAQTSKALISGIVTDGSGAAIHNAKVTITDTARNQDFRAETNSSGVYRVIELTPSTYRVTAEAPGFRTYVLEPLRLSTQQNATLNISLEIGAITEKVEVTATGPLLEASSAALSAVVENKKIIELPLNNRNIYTLLTLVPGITPSTPNNAESDFFTSTIRFSINGGKESVNDIQLDGVSAMVQSDIQGIYGASAIPSVEGIQEFRVQTNSYTAEYGRSGGGQVTMITKSGTNQFHGSAFEFLRNSAMDAKNFFTNRNNLPKASLQQHQYGASVGGRVIKDKTFFFALYEKKLTKSGSLGTFTVPTAAQLGGDFSNTRNANGAVRPIYDPFSTRADPDSPGNFIRTPFANNRIPITAMDPIALNVLKLYPAANGPGTNVFTAQNNLAIQKVPQSPTDRVDFKVDHNFNPNRRMFARYNWFKQATAAADFWDNGAAPSDGIMYWGSHNAALDYTEIIGSGTIINIRGGLSLFHAWRPAFSYGYDVTKLGFPQSLQDVTLKTGAPRIPRFDIQDYNSVGPNNGSTYTSDNVAYSLVGNITKLSGKHSIKAGGDVRMFTLGFAQFGSSPANFSFTRLMTQGPNPLVAGNGDGLASFLLGAGTSGAATHRIKPADSSRYYAMYAQDDYKFNSKLTFNVGLRYELEGSNTERYDQQTIMDPYAKNPLSDKTGLDLRGVYLFSGENQSAGRRGVRSIEHKLNPRFGIAYQLNQKTVIRTGYGIFYGVPKFAATDRYTGAPYASTTPWNATLDTVNPTNLLRNPFPQGYVLPVGRGPGALSGVGFALSSAWASEMKTPYNQQWNFNIQRHLTNNMMFEVSYAGNKGTHNEIVQGDLGQLRPEQLTPANNLLTLVPNPFFGLIDPASPLGAATVQRGRLLRGQFAEFTSVGPGNPAWGNSNYHSFQTRFENRFGGGASMGVAYTWSKSIADSSDGIWNDGQGTLRNWYCRSCERSLTTYDVPHRMVVNYNYELPFGKGRKYGTNMNWLANAILGGWQSNGVFTIASGQPLIFSQTTNNSFSFGGSQRPDVVGGDARIPVRSIDKWYDTTQFRVAANYTFGTMSRTHSNLRADFTRGLNFSLFKNTRVRERLNVQFRAEAFNLTNTPVFAAPNNNVESGAFGTVTGQSNGPRTIQLGLKLLF